MNKLIKAMAILCPIYDTGFSNLEKEYQIVVEWSPSRRVDFVLGDSSYNMEKDPNRDHEKYDLFESSYMNDEIRVLAEVKSW